MSIRELPPLRLHDEITSLSGTRHRWGPDEPNGVNVPSGRRDSSTMPGGFETADATLPRKAGADYSDLDRLSTLRRLGAGGEIAWEGRLERAPQASGDQIAISPSAVGWQAHLDDDKSVREIYRDIDMTKWGGGLLARKLALNANFQVSDGEVAQGTTSNSVRTSFIGPWGTTPARPITEAWYDALGIPIGIIYYAWTRGANVNNADTNWTWAVVLTSDDAGTSSDATVNLRAAGPSASALTATTADRTYAYVTLSYANVASTSQAEFAIDWTQLIVYGTHNLNSANTDPDGGFYDADIIRNALDRWCPLLSHTTESLTPSSFVIPHLVFLDPTTVSDVVRQATRFGLRDWAVWEDKTFWLHDRGARGRNWRARIGPAQLEETGPQVDRLWESVIVQYQDVDGSTRTVGPVGSGANTEDDTLKDTDPDNPANKLGITRRDLLVMGTGTAASATEVGRRFLEEQKALDTSGRATFTGYVMDDRGVTHPYWKVRAGDTVTFVDASDTSARRIVRAENDHDSQTCTIDLDSPPEGLSALLERLGVVLVPLGL
jgi:hypothetical protein